MTVQPLLIDPYPIPDDVMNAIKTAKASLNLPFQVLPQRAVPGPRTRVLALKGVPWFVCDSAIVTDWRDPERLKAALLWVLDETQLLERGFTVNDWMKHHLGAVEITTASDRFEYEEQLRQVRFGNG